MSARAPSADHPSRADWQRYVRGTLPRETNTSLARHLSQCDACQAVWSSLPLPPTHVLGRPVHPILGASPDSAKEQAERLAAQCLRAMERGGIIAVQGGDEEELLVLDVLAQAVSLLRKRNRHAMVTGSPYQGTTLPARPDWPAVVLLRADAWPAVAQWASAGPGQVTVLASRHGAALPGEPFAVTRDRATQAVERLRPYRAQVREALLSGPAIWRLALWCSALERDVPSRAFGTEPLGEPLAHVRYERGKPTGWVCAEVGSWLTRAVVQDLAAEDPEWADTCRRALPAFAQAHGIRLPARFPPL